MPSRFFPLYALEPSVSNRMGVSLLPSFIAIHVFNANSVDPNQTSWYAAYDLDLHCKQMFFLMGRSA